MFSEMVSEIAAFLEDTAAVGVHALEIQLNPLCLRVTNLDCLVPVGRNSFESLRNISLRYNIVTLWLVVFVQGID